MSLRKPIPPSIDATLTRAEREKLFELHQDNEPLTDKPTRAQVLIGEDFYSEWNPFEGRCHRIVRVRPAQHEGK